MTKTIYHIPNGFNKGRSGPNQQHTQVITKKTDERIDVPSSNKFPLDVDLNIYEKYWTHEKIPIVIQPTTSPIQFGPGGTDTPKPTKIGSEPTHLIPVGPNNQVVCNNYKRRIGCNLHGETCKWDPLYGNKYNGICRDRPVPEEEEEESYPTQKPLGPGGEQVICSNYLHKHRCKHQGEICEWDPLYGNKYNGICRDRPEPEEEEWQEQEDEISRHDVDVNCKKCLEGTSGPCQNPLDNVCYEYEKCQSGSESNINCCPSGSVQCKKTSSILPGVYTPTKKPTQGNEEGFTQKTGNGTSCLYLIILGILLFFFVNYIYK